MLEPKTREIIEHDSSVTGFYLNYCPSLDTFAAMRLMDLVEQSGGRCLVLATDRVRGVDSSRDRSVITASNDKVTKWLTTCSHIVWVDNISYKHVRIADHFGIQSSVYVTWPRPLDECRLVCQMVDNVICPSRELCISLKERWGLRNTIYLPWDPGIPPVLNKPKDIEPGHNLLITVCDKTTHGLTSTDLVYLAIKILKKIPDSTIKFLGVGSYPPSLRRSINTLKSYYPERISSVVVRSWIDVVTHLSLADLVMFTDTDKKLTVGVLPITALTLGVPVVAFDLPLIREYVSDKANGILVPCRYKTHKSGTFRYDILAFEKSVIRLLTSKTGLRKLSRGSSDHLESRRKIMMKSWSDVFSH